MSAAYPRTDGASPGDVVLRALRIALHTAFAGLLLLAVIQMSMTAQAWPVRACAYAGSAVLAAVYVAGTVIESRHASTGRGPDPRRYGAAWLAVVTVLWLCLLVISPEFSWLAFPLFFLDLQLLRTVPALGAVLVTTAAVILAQWARTGQPSAAAFLGPVIGALFAVVMGSAYSSLHRESVNQRLALAELHRTRGELAASQHYAGVLTERERLAREIHDTLAQGLSSIVLLSRAAGSALDAGDPALAKERIGLVQGTAAENLAEARRFVRGLAAAPLERGSLDARLAALCSDTARRAAAGVGSLRCMFRVDGTPVPLHPAYEATLLRAAQSLLANIEAHAGASNAVVTLEYSPDSVALDVFDDGGGFDPEALPTGPRADGSGFGLLSLRERIADLHGSLSVESAPGEGTVVALRLPLDAATDSAAVPGANA
ncbi:sensor histidine kinase [Arthrobacter sp. 08Y14]|uniref:sensor histidine kinase n=1 Tax=Arthrobacter sp. 08Y14 TaxID=2058885 RepID=UPI000CE51ED9|nr:sensor histidine kinase [Arthrobacter sp. 08Y14]